MPRRTNTDSIRELEIAVATISERVEKIRVDIGALENHHVAGGAESKKFVESISEVRTRLAVIEQRFEDLKTSVEQREQKRWAVVLIIISALAGGVLSVILQKLLP